MPTQASTSTRQEALTQMILALFETVKEAGPRGAPSGPMYAACMNLMSLDQYQTIMGILVKSGKIRLSNHVYYFIE